MRNKNKTNKTLIKSHNEETGDVKLSFTKNELKSCRLLYSCQRKQKSQTVTTVAVSKNHSCFRYYTIKKLNYKIC